MKNNKGIIHLLPLLTVGMLIVSLGGIMIWKFKIIKKDNLENIPKISDLETNSDGKIIQKNSEEKWGVYKNDEYDFKVNYLNNWSYETGDYPSAQSCFGGYYYINFGPIIKGSKVGSLFTINIFNSEGLSIQQFFNKENCEHQKTGDDILANSTLVKVDNIDAYRLRRFGESDFPYPETWRVYWVVLKRDGYIFRLRFNIYPEDGPSESENKINDEIVDQILNSFEFIN